MKKTFEKKKFLIAILTIFIAFNLMVIGTIFANNSNAPYPKEKGMMQTSAFITTFYIIPLSKVFGNHNILTLPFYAVRDKLYNTAYNRYPKDEAEKDIQWYAVKGHEYEVLYRPLLKDFVKNPEKLANNKEMWQWTDEFYNNAMLLAHEKTNQPFFNKFIYHNYIQEIAQYLLARPLLFLARDNNSYQNMLNDSIETSRLNSILVTSEKLKNDFKKNNPESLNYFYNNLNVSYQEFLNKYKLYVYLLTSKINNEKFSCKDSFVNKYIYNRKEMVDYLNNPPKETVKTANVECAHDALYKWQLNNDLEQRIVTQCKIELE